MSLRLFAIFALGTALCSSQDLKTGIEQLRSAKLNDAASTLQRVVDRQPKSGRGRYYLAMALYEQNKGSEAQKVLNAPDDSNGQDYVQLGKAWGQLNAKDYSGAEDSIAKAESINSGNPELPYVRGVLKVAKKDYGGGASDLDKAISISPTNANAHYYAGMAYNGLKRPDKMVQCFQTFLKLAPDSPQAAKVRSLMQAVR